METINGEHFLYFFSTLNKERVLEGHSNRPRKQKEMLPSSLQYPLINYLDRMYELTCTESSCSWSEMAQQPSPSRMGMVAMHLPDNFSGFC